MSKKIMLWSLLVFPIVVFAQDSTTTTFFPWVKDGQLCQINAKGEIQAIENSNQVNYPTFSVKNEFKAYTYQGLQGFKDNKGKIVIKAGYEKVGNFREGFAWVKLDHKRFYYIDKNEKPLLNFTFDRCFDFQNGLARVFDKSPNFGYNGFGYLNTAGKVVIPLQYKKAYDFVNGYALVKDQRLQWWLINPKGEKVQGPCKGLKSKKNIFSVVK